MKKLIILFAMLAGVFAPAHAETAESVLNSAAAQLSKGSVTAAYTAKSPDGSVKGTLTMSGSRFMLDACDIKMWYDGKTLWAYSRRAGEVNISEPTPDELAEVAPLSIISAYRRAYTPRLVNAPKGFKKVTLTASSRHANIKSITITLNAATMLPTALVVTASNGSTMTVTVTSAKKGNALPASSFTFPKASYKGVEIVDMR